MAASAVHTDEEENGGGGGGEEENSQLLERSQNEEEEEETENQHNNVFRNYNATAKEGRGDLTDSLENTGAGMMRSGASAKSEDDLVVGDRDSWDPNNTNRFVKEGDQNNVIIEVGSFSLNERSDALRRDDIQRMFVGMNFLNYDPSELESQVTMPKAQPNVPIHFNFRKSRDFFLCVCWFVCLFQIAGISEILSQEIFFFFKLDKEIQVECIF